MKIIFYCQYVLGMGHFFRSLQIARALSDHDVTLVVGGQKVAVNLPGHVRLVRLPVLYMDEKFTQLISGEPGQTVEAVLRQRREMLHDLVGTLCPDLFMVELYPFGRTIFQTELDPLLTKIGAGDFGPVKRVCSLRDVLVEKKDPVEYEERVLGKLNRLFDLLLIHSDGDFLRLDRTFGRVTDIRIPVRYTGFVTRKPKPGAREKIREDRGIRADERLVVASAGGGRTGFPLLYSVAEAFRLLREGRKMRLELFAGPFMDEDAYASLKKFVSSGVSVRRFTKNLPDYLAAADLSISMAGYNTCMDLLVMQIPALVFPYRRQQEQPIRAEKIEPLLPMKIIGKEDLDPGCMRRHIIGMLDHAPRRKALPLNLEGAADTARFLSRWLQLGNRSQ